MRPWRLAQINVAKLKAPIDAPEIAAFVANLDRINALAESSPGFLWRLKGEGNDATDLAAFDDPMVITNMSVWESAEHLAAFVYRSDHGAVMRRRAEWFHEMEVFMCLWWVPAGHEPGPAEGRARLEMLQALGPTQHAFTFKERFAAPESDERLSQSSTNAPR